MNADETNWLLQTMEESETAKRFDREGEVFEEARLRGIIGEFKGIMVQELATALWEGVKTFTAGVPQSDDITVLVVQ